MKLFEPVLNPREIRLRLGLNQQAFWTQIGVTQSGGSRYESGRKMPKPVRELLRLVHVEQIDIAKVKKEDLEVAEHVRIHHPEIFQSARRAIREKQTLIEGSQQSAPVRFRSQAMQATETP